MLGGNNIAVDYHHSFDICITCISRPLLVFLMMLELMLYQRMQETSLLGNIHVHRTTLQLYNATAMTVPYVITYPCIFSLSLICDADERLGRNGIDDFKLHPFFKGIEWEILRSQKPPYIPEFTSEADTRNFEPYEPEDDGVGKHVRATCTLYM